MSFPTFSIMKREKDIDPVVKFFVGLAKKHFKQCKIILFGSRARGDNKEKSDYDFAVDDKGIAIKKWALFSLEVQEKAPTLKEIEIVRLSQVDKALKNRILKEGKIIYE